MHGQGFPEGGVPPVSPTPHLGNPFSPGVSVLSTLLRACSAAQLLQHSPLAKIVLFNKDAEAAFRPRFFICFPQSRKKRYRFRGEGEGSHTWTHTRANWNSWITSRATWLVRRGFRWKEEFCSSKHRWCSRRWKIVRRSDWIHVRRKRKMDTGETDRQKKKSHN